MDKTVKRDLFRASAILIAAVFLVLFALFMWSGCSSSTKTPSKLVLRSSEDYNKIIDAYSNVLHRVWIDRPSYVEDVLWETDEILVLEMLLGGDWDMTFEFHDEQDSIDYNDNWMRDFNTIRFKQ